MLEERNLKLDLLALGLLALTIFLAAALLSYNPADPPAKLVYPQLTETGNMCGRSGALVSAMLFGMLGLGAYYLLVSLAVLDSVLLVRRTISDPVTRFVGWLLSLVGFTTLVAMALPGFSPGPVIGSGGYLGAAGRGLLEMHFASVGAYILTVSLILGGLLLCTDYVLIRLLTWSLGAPTRSVGRGTLRVAMAYAGRVWKNLSPDEASADEEDCQPPVRMADRDTDEEDEEADEATDEQDEADDDEVDPETSAGRTKPLPLRIHKPKKSRPEELIEEFETADSESDATDYELPSIDLLLESEPFCFEEHEKDVRRKARILEKTFADFGFDVRVVEIQTGPVIAQFEVELEAGLRLSKITSLSDDLAIALRVPSVRIVAPIPGKNTVGIEVPNQERQLVRLREVMEEANGKIQKMRIPVFLGKDVAGNPIVIDLATLPHLLIAGQTGTGKSVCLNSVIVSMLMTRRPDEVRMLLIDPKMVELSPYNTVRHLMHPVVTDMRKAEAILAWAVEKMGERYQLLAQAGVRHISVYNQLGEEELIKRIQPANDEERRHIPSHLPYVVIVADEIADLMMTAAKEVEGHIIRLAQKSRAVGIHLVLATQKPTVDVITGLIKSNLPARLSFQVGSRTDSRVVLDEIGADKLLGSGDMLLLWPGTSTLIRGQGTYLCDDEINQVIAAVSTSEPQFVKELVQLKPAESGAQEKVLDNRDELYEAAVDVVVREGRGSVSLLQRALGIGYGRGARLIDYMAEDGIVGPYNGSQAREVLISLQDWEVMSGQTPTQEPSTPAPRRSNRIFLGRPEDETNVGLPEVQTGGSDAECAATEDDPIAQDGVEAGKEEYEKEEYAEEECDVEEECDEDEDEENAEEEEYAYDEADEELDEEDDEYEEEEYEEDEHDEDDKVETADSRTADRA